MGRSGCSVLHAEAAVLGDAAFGDVELRHDLDARDDGRVVLAADGRHGLGQHAVDAELDLHRVVAALDVNITGPALQGGKDGGVDQADDGAVAFGGEPVDGDAAVFRAVFVADDVERKAFAGFFQNALATAPSS